MELEEFLNSFEASTNISVPEVLKNILELMEHSKFTISKLTEKEIRGMEQSLYSTVQDMGVPEKHQSKYFGKFSGNPKKFRFLQGQELILKELISFAQPKQQNKEKNSFLSSSGTKRKLPNEGDIQENCKQKSREEITLIFLEQYSHIIPIFNIKVFLNYEMRF